MKKLIRLISLFVITTIYSTAQAACPTEPGCTTDWLNVPGDFTKPANNFSMYLLNGWVNLDFFDGANWVGIDVNGAGGIAQLNTIGNKINFTATQFDEIGPGHGTSTLDIGLNNYLLGTANAFGTAATFYTDGQASGSLVDTNGSTQGHWTLNTHLFADWARNKVDLGLMPLSTNTSYSYNVAEGCDDYGNCVAAHDAIAAGSIMDYHSGLAYLVGQGIVTDGPLNGIRVTVGLQGQDPLSSPVPVPAAAWLLGSGLIGLAGVARKHKVA